MNPRRFRSSQAEILDRACWLGWMMLMMFALVQTAGVAS